MLPVSLRFAINRLGPISLGRSLKDRGGGGVGAERALVCEIRTALSRTRRSAETGRPTLVDALPVNLFPFEGDQLFKAS
jgi:hypothetical protein